MQIRPVRFFRPGKLVASVFGALLVLAYLGYTQTWAFGGADTGIEKPPLYDAIRGFPFWLMWVFSITPLAGLSNLLVVLGGYEADFVMRGEWGAILPVMVAYYYVASCVVARIWERFRSRAALTRH